MPKTKALPSQSVQRVSGVLLSFTAGEQTLGVTQIASRLGIAKSAVHRTLTSLMYTGLIARDTATARYRLGPRAAGLAMAAFGMPDIRTQALPLLEELVEKTRESSTLSVAIGQERVYVAQVEGPQVIRMAVQLGRRQPLYAGASGKAILAFLPPDESEAFLAQVPLAPLTTATVTDRGRLLEELLTIRKSGYATSSGERDPGAGSVAAPIFNSSRVIGAISVCGPTSRITGEKIPEYGQLVREAAKELSRLLA
jgi:DNA-binding IclR family transcriptional regulator